MEATQNEEARLRKWFNDPEFKVVLSSNQEGVSEAAQAGLADLFARAPISRKIGNAVEIMLEDNVHVPYTQGENTWYLTIIEDDNEKLHLVMAAREECPGEEPKLKYMNFPMSASELIQWLCREADPNILFSVSGILAMRRESRRKQVTRN